MLVQVANLEDASADEGAAPPALKAARLCVPRIGLLNRGAEPAYEPVSAVEDVTESSRSQLLFQQAALAGAERMVSLAAIVLAVDSVSEGASCTF